MQEYFQIGVCVFLLWTLSVTFLKTAPARIKFHLTIASLCVWLVPWPTIKIDIPMLASSPLHEITVPIPFDLETRIQPSQNTRALVSAQDSAVTSSSPHAATAVGLNNIFPEIFGIVYMFFSKHVSWFVSLALIVGLILFSRDVLRYCIALKRWRTNSDEGGHYAKNLGIKLGRAKVRILHEQTPGMASGLSRPTIWISSDISDSNAIRAVLSHELAHIQNHDTYWVWFIAFLRRLFWWNPLVWWLCCSARDYMEFSCDELCNHKLKVPDYAFSLTQLVISKHKVQETETVLGIYRTSNLNVQRVQALLSPKKLGFVHVGVLCFFVVLSVSLSLLFASDPEARNNNKKVSANALNQLYSTISEVEVTPWQEPFFKMVELIELGEYQTAEKLHDKTILALKKNGLFDTAVKVLAFRIKAMILSDAEKYSEIISAFYESQNPELAIANTDINRILSICHIKLGQIDQAIELMLKADDMFYRTGPSKVLLAQAYHLAGDYNKSNRIIESELPRLEKSVYFETKIAMLRLFGKNNLLLGHVERMSDIRSKLGEHAPEDFLEVKADQQTIPYVYFSYQAVAGIDIDAVDRSVFPLPQQPPQVSRADINDIVNSAEKFVRRAHYNRAIELVEKAVQMLEFDSGFDTQERTALLEYLFVISLKGDKADKLLNVAENLAVLDGVQASIKARVHHVLAASNEKDRLHKRFHHFEKYLAMFGERNIAANHETLKLYRDTEHSAIAEEALERVIAFYDENNIIPDIRVTNSIISHLDKLDQSEQAREYRALLLANYPRAYNFIYE